MTSATAQAATTYWNVFNIEGEGGLSAAIVTYSSLGDMLSDTNRTGLFEPNSSGFGKNIVDSGSDGSSYWNVFNVEGENSLSAAIVTYSSLGDMLSDTNRTGLFQPNSIGFGRNVVGSGSDGSNYWNVFNIEGEGGLSAAIVTYSSLGDMLSDTNRTGLFEPNSSGFGKNIVDSGSDGSSYWNVFNVEGENSLSAAIVTYSSLDDMLSDTNRTGLFQPNSIGFGRNVVGSGATLLDPAAAVPEPKTWAMMLLGFGFIGSAMRASKRRQGLTVTYVRPAGSAAEG